MNNYFDYQKLVDELNINPQQLKELEQLVREDYQGDEMMFELRMLRTLSAIKEGALDIKEALSSFRTLKITGSIAA